MPRYILGAGAHGRVIADIFHSNEQHVDGFLDDDVSLHSTWVAGLPVVGGTSLLFNLRQSRAVEIIAALGNAPVRLELTECFRKAGCKIVNAIHHSAVISSSSSTGVGVCVCAGVVINPDVSIGNAVIVNTGATVDHDCVIGDGSHLSPGVHLAGRVHIGRLSFLGTGVSVIPRVNIGAGSVIGAGAVVVDNIPDGVLALGVPARVVRVLTESFDWGRLL